MLSILRDMEIDSTRKRHVCGVDALQFHLDSIVDGLRKRVIDYANFRALIGFVDQRPTLQIKFSSFWFLCNPLNNFLLFLFFNYLAILLAKLPALLFGSPSMFGFHNNPVSCHPSVH